MSRLSRAGGIFVELSHEGLAEQVGFEPTHGLRRLTVFNTVPFNPLVLSHIHAGRVTAPGVPVVTGL